jgi:hypothetical protein
MNVLPAFKKAQGIFVDSLREKRAADLCFIDIFARRAKNIFN